MAVGITYHPNLVPPVIAEAMFTALWEGTEWERRSGAPRNEYWINPFGLPYTYGSGQNARMYKGHGYDESVTGLLVWHIGKRLEALTGASSNCCFLNGYQNGSDFLGWHADDSPEMSHDYPIATVSFGATRELWVKPKDYKGVIPDENKHVLRGGSALIMPAGMQRDWLHRIPKASQQSGPRVSLTFRTLTPKAIHDHVDGLQV